LVKQVQAKNAHMARFLLIMGFGKWIGWASVAGRIGTAYVIGHRFAWIEI